MGKLVAFLWCYRVFLFYDGKDIITWEHGFILPVYCAAGLSVTFYIWESGLHYSYCSHRHGQRIYFFFFDLSLHITQTVVSAWQETPVLQKFQANSTTNKVFTAYPFLQNRQESRLKVLTVRCLFCCIMCHTHTDVPQLMLWNPIILLNTGRLCLAVTICLYTISNFYLLILFYCIYILNINVSLMPLLFLSFFVFSHVRMTLKFFYLIEFLVLQKKKSLKISPFQLEKVIHVLFRGCEIYAVTS